MNIWYNNTQKQDAKAKEPEKPGETGELTDEIEYTYQLFESVGEEILQSERSGLIEPYERIKELC